ncbi:MAG TPA: L-threonylcarbamoyladenylate synthase [Spirochaetota bacterium]|nr:L-threonylcarbamoyladenylate synthase [Spirochaetota bacterium]
MIEYVYSTNIDDRVLQRVKNILDGGGLVAYPTDASFGVGCSSHSKLGIEKLRKLKGGFNNFALTFVCSKISQISEVTELTNANFRFIKKYTPGPFVFILKALPQVEKKINMKRSEIGTRIPDNPIPQAIVDILGFPMFGITASKRMEDNSLWDKLYAEENLFEYGYELENIREIDLILDDGEFLAKNLSTVVRMTGDEPEVIRTGVGIL